MNVTDCAENNSVKNRIINGVCIHSHERVDDLHRNGLLIIQDPKRFCFGVDAVILSGFCKIKKGDRVLDLGTGTGILPILLSAKTEGAGFTGIEIQSESVDMARRSVLLNDLSGKIKIDEGDIKDSVSLYGSASFDVVCSNPPYMTINSGKTSDFSPKAIARHEILCTQEDVISAAASLLRYGGHFYMVSRPERLADIFCCMRTHKLEAKTMRCVHSRIGKSPILVLVEAVRGGNPSLTIGAPFIIYEGDGSKYTAETERVYYG